MKTLTKERKEERFAYLIMLPVGIYFVAVIFYPLLWAIYTSFTNKMIGTSGRFVGLKNYIAITKDWEFWKATSNTLIYTLFAVSFKVLFGMIMALIINANIRARSLFRALLILPWTIPTLITALTWKWMFSDIGGVIPYFTELIFGSKNAIPWLTNPEWAMVSVILVNVWRGVPFLGISILSGLQTIPSELYEAAQIDGASKRQCFFHITLPSIKLVVLLATLVTTIWTLNDFQIVWVITRGGPVFGTHLISTYSYNIGFSEMNLAKAISVSVFFLPFLVLLVNKITKVMLGE